ncbi:MAG: alanine--tRNA ligase [Acidobacteria bacterium]|nr:alanine--tRNA ligase [Acidobacteriota bacterium]MBI3424180.1 alanine--tRNA ligase [Acidobacteriota bacterium]
MTGHEIRQIFLQYFAQHGHKIVKSSPLLPANDPTLLFTNAGMNQFKDVFIGAETSEYKRATSSQKCIRAGGKHNDLDEVGKTARHHTFFEMLGNFSFGDYFKEDAIKFAWELLVNEYKIDPVRLWFSVFEGDAEVPADEEAVELWVKAGAPRDRVLKFGRKDNFWQMGETGPCGPCSEIHYYMGEHPEDPAFNKPEFVNGPGDDTIEIWNLVFMQYNRSEIAPGQYKLDPLPAPSVDTGMGLERTAAVLQGVKTNYDTDLIKPIIEFTAKLAGKEYKAETQEGFAMRVVADHARSTAFAIADGILPGNEGRNYVLRKIMRRAIYHGRNTLGIGGLFFSKVCEFVIEFMQAAYPELGVQHGFIEKMVRLEEERFGTTLSVGLKKLEELMKEYQTQVILDDRGDVEAGHLPANELARLYDTFGTPIDLMFVVLSTDRRGETAYCRNAVWKVYRRGETPAEIIQITEDDFRGLIEKELAALQLQTGSGKSEAKSAAKPIYVALSRRHDTKTDFKGYETVIVDNASITALIVNGNETQSFIGALLPSDSEVEVVLDQTPFYAESGGQVGDVGILVNDKFRALVQNTYSPVQGLVVHKVKVEKGSLKVGDTVSAQVDVEKRDATRRNHTATHLMHAALREVLGTHVKQAGSIVAPDYLRFDFSHYQPLTSNEIEEIENLVNFHILRNEPVQTDELAIEEAMRSGAMALFGEKYGEKVRVLTVNGAEGIFSKELCGGTHVRATGDIGSFKIISDEAIASGTRRIRAVTGKGAFERFQTTEHLLAEAAGKLNAVPAKLPSEIERLQTQLREQQREIERLKLKLAQGGGGSEDQVAEINGLKVLVRKVEDLGKDGRRQLADSLSRKIAPGVVVIGDVVDGKASLLVMVSNDALGRVQAGKIIKALPGVRGGGKPDLAEGGVELDQLDAALQTVVKAVEATLA